MRVYYWPSEHWVDDDAHTALVDVATAAERDIRTHLPALEEELYLLANQTSAVIPETGDGGFTIGPQCTPASPPSQPSRARPGSAS